MSGEGGRERAGQGGFLLPLALLGLLAVTALAMTSFVLVLGMLRDTTLERRYVEGWAGARPVDSLRIGGGFVLVRLPGPHLGTLDGGEAGGGDPAGPGAPDAGGGAGEEAPRMTYRVERLIDPFADARRWTAPLYAPLLFAPAGEAVTRWAPPPCGGGNPDPATGTGPLLRFHGAIRDLLPPEGPEGDGPAWVDRITWDAVEAAGTALRWVPGPTGAGWLFSAGDVELRGSGPVSGILLSEGRVTLGSGVGWSGGIAAIGPVQVESGGEVVGDWCIVESVLELLPPPRRLELPGGGPLGRF